MESAAGRNSKLERLADCQPLVWKVENYCPKQAFMLCILSPVAGERRVAPWL
jgi:hypothetical protein